MCASLSRIAALSVIVVATIGASASEAAWDRMLSSDRLADTYVPNEIGQLAPEIVSETYFVPLPRSCPRTPAGYSRWDLPCR